MCNIAGYIGQKQATPILIELIKKQEAYAGGYYTGIAVLNDGVLQSAKLTGALKDFLEKTDGANYKGNMGIMHSRSNAGGGDNWAMPFIARKNDKDYLAYAATGCTGVFKPNNEKNKQVAIDLFNENRVLLSRQEGINSTLYPQLPDGAFVHISDVMCHLVHHFKDEGISGDKAMAKAFLKMPLEITGLSINTDETDFISFSRINGPLYVAFAKHGAYVASMPNMFEQDASEPIRIPANCSGRIFKDHIEITPFEEEPVEVVQQDQFNMMKAYELAYNALKQGEKNFWQTHESIMPLFNGMDCFDPIYEILECMDKQGILNIRLVEVVGARKDLTAPQYMFSIK